MQDNSDNNINIHDQTRNRSEAENTTHYLIACMQRSEKQKKVNNWDNHMLEEEMDAVAGEGTIHGSPMRSLLTKSPKRMPQVSQFDNTDYWALGHQRIGEVYGMNGSVNTLGQGKRSSSHGLNNNSKLSEEIFKDMQFINITKSKLGKQQKLQAVNSKFGIRNEQSDVNALAILTSQVLGNVLENDSDLANEEHYDDEDMCDVRSNDLGEGRRGSVAPIKRTIDLQHQINKIKKDYLGYFINNYDNLLKDNQAEQEIEFQTGDPKENIQNTNGTAKSNQKQVNNHILEKIDLLSLNSVPDMTQSQQQKNENIKKQIQSNARKFILKLIQLDVQEKYNKAIVQANSKQQTKLKKRKDQSSNNRHLIENPYYKTTKIQHDLQSRLTGKSTTSQSKPINIDKINADLLQIQRSEVPNEVNVVRQRSQPQIRNNLNKESKMSQSIFQLKPNYLKGNDLLASLGQLNDSFSKTKQYATQNYHKLGFQQMNHNNNVKQKTFEKHLDNIIAEQDHEEEEDLEQFPSPSQKPNQQTIQIPEHQNLIKPLLVSAPDKVLLTPVLKRNIKLQSFEGPQSTSFNQEVKQEEIGPKRSIKKSHSMKTESIIVKSKNDIFEDDDDNHHFDAGCDLGVIAHENIQVQNVRDTSWASIRCDSISNSSTKSRKRHCNDNGKGEGYIRNRSSKIVSNGKQQLTSDENIYGVSYGKVVKATEVDNIDEKTVSNSVKRSLIKQQKWTEQKQIKISLVESHKISGNSSNKQVDVNQAIEDKIQQIEDKDRQNNNLFYDQSISLLQQQNNCYLKNKEKIEERIADITTIDVIRDRFKNNKIKCIKYNYSLDKEVQTLGAFDGYFQLSQNGQYLNIYNKKSIRKPQYVFDPDYRIIREKRQVYQQTLKRDELTNKISDDNFQENIDFVCRKSSSSTKLSDIENILFGGLSSRFWMFRKHMIQQKKFNLSDEKMAFFSWQCITLQLKDREVDLVVPNEKDMDQLLELLIDAMNTTNGFKNSADPIKQQIHQQKYKTEIKRQTKIQQRRDMKKIKFLDQQKIWKETELTQQELNRIKKTTLTKYKIMRVRAKISFIAFQKQKTVFELMFDQILQSFVHIAKLKEQEQGDLKDQFELFRMNDHAFQQMISDGMGNIFERIMQLNVKELKHQDLVAYVKLKFQQAVDIMEQDDDEMEEVRDKVYMKRKKVKINEMENLEKAMQNARNLNRNASMDIFLQMEKQIKNKSILDTVNYRDVLRYKQQKYKVHKAYQKLKIVVNMKAVKGVMMLKALITKIKFAKQIFILEIEQSREAYIPNELSNDNLPSSFWFYDACLHQVQNLIIDEKKTFAFFKNQYRLNFYQKNNFKRYLKIKMGFIDDPQKPKLSQKSQIINEIESKIIDHNTIPTSLNLQRSRYVTIDEDVTRLQKYYKVQGKLQQQQLDKQITIRGCANHVKLPVEMRDEARMLILRYCPDWEITIQRQELLHAKSTFLNKIIFLKILGKKLILMQKVDNHIETNIDQIYRDYIKLHPRKQKANKTVYEVIMSDKLEKEDEDQAKKKLHSIMMDHIEKWLQHQTVKLRYMNTREIREKTGPQRQFHAKNYFVETDLEKHIKWFSKVRGFDIQGALVDEMHTVKKSKNDKLDRKRLTSQAKKQQMTQNNDSVEGEDDMQAQEDHLFAELAMLTTVTGRQKQEALQEQMDQTLYKFNQQRIDMLKKKIQDGQDQMIQDARKLNEQRQLYKKLLGVQQNLNQNHDDMYQTNLKSFDANIFSPPDNIIS